MKETINGIEFESVLIESGLLGLGRQYDYTINGEEVTEPDFYRSIRDALEVDPSWLKDKGFLGAHLAKVLEEKKGLRNG